jgi:ParB/RepB/Spo0J family partition protein
MPTATKKPATKKPTAKKAPRNPQSAIQIPQSKVPTTTYPVLLTDPAKVHISAHNTRQPTADTCKELITSIAATGQITAAIVRPHPTKKGEYELAAGARRRTAALALGVQLKIEVRPLTDDQLLDFILTENLQREDPDPFAEAALIKKRLSEGVTADEIAAIYGKEPRWVSRRMKLNSIIPALVTRLTGGDLDHYTLPMAELLGSIPEATQKTLAKETYTLSNANSFERLSRAIQAENACLTPAVIKAFADPATFVKGCGPGGCATASDSSLFPELAVEGKGADCAKCLNAPCFTKRLVLAQTLAITRLLENVDYKKLILFTEAHVAQSILVIGGIAYESKRSWELSDYTFSSKAPSEPGTIAIQLDNPAAPKLHYLTPKPKSSGSGGKSGPTPAEKARAAVKKQAKADGEKLTEDEVTAAVRRTNHQRKRWKHVHELLCTALEKLSAPDLTPDRWLALFVTFGSGVRRNTFYDSPPKKAWAAYAKLDPASTTTGPLVAAVSTTHGLDTHAIFRDHFHDLFQSRLKFFSGMENFDDDAELRQEMTHIATLIGFDLAKAKLTADHALPPPKSLGKVHPNTLLPL